MFKKVGTSIAGLLIFSLLVNGQDGFTATAPAVVKRGDQFQYVISGSERGEVRIPAMDHFDLLGGPYSSYSSHSNWVNGKMTTKTEVSYTYVLGAVSEGTFTIPSSTVKVGRKEYKTNEVEVVVNASGPAAAPGGAGTGNQGGEEDRPIQGSSGDDQVFLRVIPSKREVYLGEQFVSGLKVYTRVSTRPGSAASDLPYEGFYKTSLEADANAQQQEIGGQTYVTQVIQRHILIPQKSGDLEITPYESEWMVPQRVQRQRSGNPIDDFFNDPFFNSMQEVPVTLTTPPVTIHVLPLPPGAPVGFTGAVGDFQMSAELSTNQVRVNEALSLKITISGTGNLPLLGEPEVNLPPDHDLYDVNRTVHTSTAGNRISGSVTFEYPIIARYAGRFRIAPVQFAWFDPKSATYKAAQTNEFNFVVEQGEDEEPAEGVYVPGIVHESVRDLGTDIRDISRAYPVFTMVRSSLLGNRWYWGLYALALVLTIALIMVIRLVTKRNADLTLVRNRKAGRMARTRLKTAERFKKSGEPDKFYEELGKAIWGYLSYKLNIETSGLSREAILEHLEKRNVPGDLQSELLRILEESEFSRFAPTSQRSDMGSLFSDAAQLIRNLESSLK